MRLSNQIKRIVMATITGAMLFGTIPLPVNAESLTIVDAEGEYVATSPDDVRFPGIIGNWAGYGFIKAEDYEAFRTAYDSGENVYAVDYAYDGFTPLPSGSTLYTIYTQQETVILIPVDADTNEFLDYDAPLTAFYEEVVSDQNPVFQDTSQEQAIADMTKLMPDLLQYLPTILEMKFEKTYYVVDGNEDLSEIYQDPELTQAFDISTPFVNGAYMYAPIYVSQNPPKEEEVVAIDTEKGEDTPSKKENSEDVIENETVEDEPFVEEIAEKTEEDINVIEQRPKENASVLKALVAGTICIGVLVATTYLLPLILCKKKKTLVGVLVTTHPENYRIALYGKSGNLFADPDEFGSFSISEINSDLYTVHVIDRSTEDVVFKAYLDTKTSNKSKVFVSETGSTKPLVCAKYGNSYNIEIELQ